MIFGNYSMFPTLDSRCLASPLALPSSGMALVRILVDGYSLLHNWPELAPGRPRHSEDARGELIRMLTLYRDACGTPITIVFDGAGKTPATAYPSTPEMEILYSRSGQTADQIIERVTVRMEPFGEVLAVTDDFAERDTVAYHYGGFGRSSCANFIGKRWNGPCLTRNVIFTAITADNARASKRRAELPAINRTTRNLDSMATGKFSLSRPDSGDPLNRQFLPCRRCSKTGKTDGKPVFVRSRYFDINEVADQRHRPRSHGTSGIRPCTANFAKATPSGSGLTTIRFIRTCRC